MSSGKQLETLTTSLLDTTYRERITGNVKGESRAKSKKVDAYFEMHDFGRTTKVFVEVKDLARRLGRVDVLKIWRDYEGIIAAEQPAILLIVTRNGLTPDGAGYVENENPNTRHQTIWQLEDNVLGFLEYSEHIENAFKENGLNNYYVNAKAKRVAYSDTNDQRALEGPPLDLLVTIKAWIESDEQHPIAILGGYGSGKSSFAKKLVSEQAAKWRNDQSERRPLLIKLGDYTGHTRLEGMLGTMFTHDFPARSFNTHRFFELNKAGRFLIVLDGFDEMKHAMTFADFRHQLEELNKLITGDSKVILLGRPTAFLSNEEHMHVLRGRRPYGNDGWRKLQDWPEFLEYELEAFSTSERGLFLSKYLPEISMRNGMRSEDSWIEDRVETVTKISASEPDLFGKPIHAKILADLAADPTMDLSSIENNVSRWDLYEIFFSDLADREHKKAARVAVGSKQRREFIESVAHWLWDEKSGSTSFEGLDLDNSILTQLPDGDAADVDAKRREYLSSSILDKKASDTYYFPHRSFAEFLVAGWLISNTPSQASTYEKHSRFARDGVAEFILDSKHKDEATSWAASVHKPGDIVSLSYLDFLSRCLGGVANLEKALNRSSPWRYAIGLFQDRIDLAYLDKTRAVKALYSHTDQNEVALIILLLLHYEFGSLQKRVSDASDSTSRRVISSLMRRIFQNVKRTTPSAVPIAIESKSAVALEIIREVIEYSPRDQECLVIDFLKLQRIAESMLYQNHSGVLWGNPLSLPDKLEVPILSLQHEMNRSGKENMITFFHKRTKLSELRLYG